MRTRPQPPPWFHQCRNPPAPPALPTPPAPPRRRVAALLASIALPVLAALRLTISSPGLISGIGRTLGYQHRHVRGWSQDHVHLDLE